MNETEQETPELNPKSVRHIYVIYASKNTKQRFDVLRNELCLADAPHKHDDVLQLLLKNMGR